jgi:DNA-directed RNA polymerase specialized sigma24 family protein
MGAEVDYIDQFKYFVKSTIRKNQAALPDLSREEIESECWLAVAIAVERWDGSKGKLSSWVYTVVTGRMKDLRKRLPLKRALCYDCEEFQTVENEMENSDQETYPGDCGFFLDNF